VKSLERLDLRAFYREQTSGYRTYLADVRQISQGKVRDYVNVLDQKLAAGIYTTNELKTHIAQAYTDAYGRALKNLFNFMEYRELEEFNGIAVERWRKAIKLRRAGVREIYISDAELQAAHENLREQVKPLFKLLVYSGARFTQTLEGVKHLHNVVIKDEICRIPINAISRGNKKAYWIYLPSSFLDKLQRFDTHFNFYYYQQGIQHGRVSASTIRKWHLNFLIEHGVPESVADFIQGRASVTVGSAHYLAKTQQADLWYAKVVPQLLEILK
jgi:intergrase/recombinase